MSGLALQSCAVTLVTAFCFAPSSAAAQITQPAAPTVFVPPANFVTVGEKPAIVYDSPSQKGNRTFVLSRFTPLEVLVKLDKWTKFRDAEGTIGWLENNVLGDRRFVQVSAGVADVHVTASAAAPVVFEAQRGVLLEIAGASSDGWVAVRHRDGQSGVVRVSQVWGG